MKNLSLLLLSLLAFIYFGCDNGDYDEVNKTGTVGVAKVLKVEDTNVTVNNDPRIDLTLTVYSKDGAPFDTKVTRTVSRVSIPREGDLRAVKFDPKDKSKVILLYQEDADKVKAELDEIASKIHN